MTNAALLLVLASAVFHATWNLLLKSSGHKAAFLWSFSAVSFAVFLVPAIPVLVIEGVGPRAALFGGVSAALHGAYGLSLARGYRLGDLSSVYPISRGMGPALIPFAAVLFLGESVSWGGALGITMVLAGVLAIHVRDGSIREMRLLGFLRQPATNAALLTGTLIAAYSLWDKSALDHLSPLALNQFGLVGYLLIMAPIAFQGGGQPLRDEWRHRRWSIAAAGVLAPGAYLLVLTALTSSNISYVAPVREVGIVFGTFLGVVFLREGYGPSRFAGSALILAGVMALAIAP